MVASAPAAAWCGGREAPAAKNKRHRNNNTISLTGQRERGPAATAKPNVNALSFFFFFFSENTFAQELNLSSCRTEQEYLDPRSCYSINWQVAAFSCYVVLTQSFSKNGQCLAKVTLSIYPSQLTHRRALRHVTCSQCAA